MDRLNSAIKIVGLAVGMSCALWAILFIRDENSFDKFHEKADRLFRITTTIDNPQDGGRNIVGATGQVQGPVFKDKIPEIQDFARVWGALGTNFIANGKSLSLNYIYADESFFTIFSFPLVYGKPSSALKALNSIVITEQAAVKCFGTNDVVGRSIKLEEGHGTVSFVITGVAKDVPTHSSIQFEAVLPFRYLQTMFPDKTWLNPYLSTFVLLQDHADINKVNREFDRVFRDEAAGQLRNANMRAGQIQFGLQSISDIHLNAFGTSANPIVGSGTLDKGSSLSYSYILAGIAGLIFIMAIINFLNLSIAGSLKRSKEIAVRKISGGSRNQLIFQFLSEASALCVISYLLAIALIITLLPIFNRLAQTNISFLFPSDIGFFAFELICLSICVLLIGLYPAIKLSFFNPVEILFNRQKFGRGSVFNKGLTVVQFTLAISLIIATIIYYKQMNFISHSDLGYDASDIVTVHLPIHRNISGETLTVLRNELNSEPSIIQMANGDLTLPDGGEVRINGNKITSPELWIDQYFLNVAGIQIREGRNFSRNFGGDSTNSIIVNEAFVREARLKDPIGQQAIFVDGGGISRSKTIVGVVRDFHYGSFREKIKPVAFILHPSEFIWVKLRKPFVAKGLSQLEDILKMSFPQFDFQYSFVSDEIRDQYKDDRRWEQVISYASALAIIICCAGLVGLVNFETLRRRKEIAVRRVLGSSVVNISLLLSRDFLKLVVLALMIASPVAWYTMNRWLHNFTYRTNISWLDFTISTFFVLLIALATVNIRAAGAAVASPVKSLRTE